MKVVDTGSQVSSLVWSNQYRELASGHGYPKNQVSLWKYPGFTNVADFSGKISAVIKITILRI